MKTWTFRLNALDKNGNEYIHVATASLSFIRDIDKRFWEFLDPSSDRDTFTTRANALHDTELTITRNRENNTFTFAQENSEWNFVLSHESALLFDEDCELISISTPSRRPGNLPTVAQIGQYLHAIDIGDSAYIEKHNKLFS